MPIPFHGTTTGHHGLKGVFCVEPLFATRLGLARLQKMVGLIQDAGHEVQLHLHTEWVDEANDGTLPAIECNVNICGNFRKRINPR